MAHSEHRFEAKAVTRLRTLVEHRCFEVHLVDAKGNTQVLTLPLAKGVELGCLICDAAETVPFLVGGSPLSRRARGSSPRPNRRA